MELSFFQFLDIYSIPYLVPWCSLLNALKDFLTFITLQNSDLNAIILIRGYKHIKNLRMSFPRTSI